MLFRSCIAAAITMAVVGAVPPAGADPSSDLMGMLPSGYGSDSCEPADPGRALAAATCRDNSLPGGPTFATYWLFGDDTALRDAFAAHLERPDWVPATCPGRESAEAAPVLGADGSPYGLIACGRGTGTDWQLRDGAVAWTHDADGFLGVAYVGYQGQAFPVALFEWAAAQLRTR